MAGRLVKEGTKSYNYSYMDKVRSVSENGAVTASFTYDVDGQIATAKTHATGKQESFLWDGLALIHRGGTSYINEPYVTGGNPILAEDKVLFNDMLGTTLGVHSEKYEPIARDAFGMTSKDADSAENFFTGKPYIGELGYAFLFRNYRPELGKLQTTDPLGYPDGWNNLAYCNNDIISGIDCLGGWKFKITGVSSSSGHYSVGQISKHPTEGTAIYINYIDANLSQSASGDGTSTLTISCSASAMYGYTQHGINVSSSLSFSIVYTVDDKGNVSSTVNGSRTSSNNGMTIIASGGGEDTLTIDVYFSQQRDDLAITQHLKGSTAGIKFEVVE